MRFEWYEAKAAANKIKHGVSFGVAQRIFDDSRLSSRLDKSSFSEERWLSLGAAGSVILLMVVHTWWDGSGEEIVRLISTRRANKHERRLYESGEWAADG